MGTRACEKRESEKQPLSWIQAFYENLNDVNHLILNTLHARLILIYNQYIPNAPCCLIIEIDEESRERRNKHTFGYACGVTGVIRKLCPIQGVSKKW